MSEETPELTSQNILEPLSLESFEGILLPLYSSYVTAGFPSPADDYLEDMINLKEHLIRNPGTTFMMRVRGNSMQDAKINDGDLLIIDSKLKPKDGYPIICSIDGEFTTKTFRQKGDRLFLEPANSNYKTIEITGEMELRSWGVITWIIHKPIRL
ncbi:LexA family protein [Rufibacter sediminis]|uniref:Translesion error-prone DNA polymerase V autoproteolytic subunit n=1 Tax=Rufibacter sediminis TaxID=2762756 RepID=A0ABR6VXM1_9BACT|nr:translesion error-prone DNA polymerase V autoproteolytic subunit [Rufibacter sediminis]MBC3541401.1 translesion error-prone DNA polymerase V autoproteolytic subunit [Rufibacter sediminis]